MIIQAEEKKYYTAEEYLDLAKIRNILTADVSDSFPVGYADKIGFSKSYYESVILPLAIR